MDFRKNENCRFTLHDELLTSLTGEQFIDLRQEDMKLLSNSRSSHTEPHTPMTTFTGHTKSSGTSESQTALNNFKRVQKVMRQPIPSSRMIFTMIHFRDHS